MKKVIALAALTCLMAGDVHGQSWGERIARELKKGIVGDLTKKSVTVGAAAAYGGDPTADGMATIKRMNWNYDDFTPLVKDGYHHFRRGVSAPSSAKTGVHGSPRHCDDYLLGAALTKMVVPADKKVMCTDWEMDLMRQTDAAGEKPAKHWGLPRENYEQRVQVFNQPLPLRLYFRPGEVYGVYSAVDLKNGQVQLIIDPKISAHDSLYGGLHDATLRIVGPDVVYEAQDYLGVPRKHMYGVFKVISSNDQTIKRVMRKDHAALNPLLRNSTYDTVYYTIHSVKKVPPFTVSKKPHYEAYVTLDRLVLGLSSRYGEPEDVVVFKGR